MTKSYSNVYEELYTYAKTLPVINTHSHHMTSIDQTYNLDTILRSSYVNWCGVSFGDTSESRRQFLEIVRFNSYFVWLEKGIMDIYDLDEPITEENWEKVSDIINKANQNDKYHLKILKERCRYEKILLDAYWNPGSNNNSDLFARVFRTDMFFHGYSSGLTDHNSNSPEKYIGSGIKDIDEYIARMRDAITIKKNEGCIALKSAIAYERSLDFNEVPKEKAQYAMTCKKDDLTKDDIKAFGDYVFFNICRIAAELDLPMQCHVGLGRLKDTNPMQMWEVIHKNPDTRFVLFHGGYPWTDEVLGLAHNCRNVYPDICWLPLISTSAAEKMLIELIEVSTIDKICWGCDTWTSEESAGALLAMEHVLASALSKKIAEGYLSVDLAKAIIKNILYKNAKLIYNL
ncbi:MAG TPA: amidohydrolase family protein [Clostridiales bacterium]|nr:amidohydrolase family protein [Clostridiales bacterium]